MMGSARNLHRLGGALQKLQHKAATGRCALCASRGVVRAAVAFINGVDVSRPKGACAEHAAEGRRRGYNVQPDPWANDGINHDHSDCAHERESTR